MHAEFLIYNNAKRPHLSRRDASDLLSPLARRIFSSDALVRGRCASLRGPSLCAMLNSQRSTWDRALYHNCTVHSRRDGNHLAEGQKGEPCAGVSIEHHRLGAGCVFPGQCSGTFCCCLELKRSIPPGWKDMATCIPRMSSTAS